MVEGWACGRVLGGRLGRLGGRLLALCLLAALVLLAMVGGAGACGGGHKKKCTRPVCPGKCKTAASAKHKPGAGVVTKKQAKKNAKKKPKK